jgi:hypothetical protein
MQKHGVQVKLFSLRSSHLRLICRRAALHDKEFETIYKIETQVDHGSPSGETNSADYRQEISTGLRFLQKGYVSDLYSTTYNCKRCPYHLSTLSIPFSSSSNKSIFDPEAFTPFPFPFPYPYPPNTTLLILLAVYALIHGSVVAHCLTLVYQKMIS